MQCANVIAKIFHLEVLKIVHSSYCEKMEYVDRFTRTDHVLFNILCSDFLKNT